MWGLLLLSLHILEGTLMPRLNVVHKEYRGSSGSYRIRVKVLFQFGKTSKWIFKEIIKEHSEDGIWETATSNVS